MSAAELTRQAIVSKTKQLTAEKSFQKTSVIDIASACGINRNTFYYYFSDKYAVIQYIFDAELMPVMEPLFTASLADNVTTLCRRMKEEKAFYRAILQDSSYHCMRQLLVQYYSKFLMEMASQRFQQHQIEGRHREIIARFYAHGTVGMICDWADRDMKMDSSFVTNIIELSARENFFVQSSKTL